jgi:hypothetical protein
MLYLVFIVVQRLEAVSFSRLGHFHFTCGYSDRQNVHGVTP